MQIQTENKLSQRELVYRFSITKLEANPFKNHHFQSRIILQKIGTWREGAGVYYQKAAHRTGCHNSAGGVPF